MLRTLLAALAVQSVVLLLVAAVVSLIFEIPVAQRWAPAELPKWRTRWPAQIASRFDDPGEMETWIIRGVAALLIIVGIWNSQRENSFWNDLWPEMVGIGVTVLGIDELNKRRSQQEYKRDIIRQMASQSNEFALDAARIAQNEKWVLDGSLKSVDLSGANLQGVDLYEANLEGANLVNANLEHANLIGANLENAKLNLANLRGADFNGANLQGANLESSILVDAELWFANMKDTFLVGADLDGANLDEAMLDGAKYTKNAKFSGDTVWPDNFDPIAAGAILVDWSETARDWEAVDSSSK